MKLKLLPPSFGVRWFNLGLAVFRRKPLAMIGLFSVIMLTALVLSSLGRVGELVFFALMPTLNVGFMLATREVCANRTPPIGVFFAPLRPTSPGRYLLIQQGLVYAGLMFAMLFLADVIDGGRLADWKSAVEAGKMTGNEAFEDVALQQAMMLRVWLTVPWAILFWHAGALAYWQQTPLVKSFFFSVMACLKNWSAFLVFGLVWSALLMMMSVVMVMLVMLVPSMALFSTVVFMGVMLLSVVFYASMFFTYADSFEHPIRAVKTAISA